MSIINKSIIKKIPSGINPDLTVPFISSNGINNILVIPRYFTLLLSVLSSDQSTFSSIRVTLFFVFVSVVLSQTETTVLS